MHLISAFRHLAALSALCLAMPVLAAQPNAPAPDFTLSTLKGSAMRLQEQRGNVVLVNFWATWCGPCREEMPHLNRLYDKYRALGFTVMAVSIDDDPAKAASMASKLGLNFPVLFDADKKVSRQYDLKAMPYTVIVDRDGRVRHLHRGYQSGYENTYDQQIRALLKE